MSGNFTSGTLAPRRPHGKELRRTGRLVEGTILSEESGTEPSQSDSSSGTSGSPGGDVGSPLRFAMLVFG